MLSRSGNVKLFQSCSAHVADEVLYHRPTRECEGQGEGEERLWTPLSRNNKPVVKKKAEEPASPLEPDSQANITMFDALAPSEAGTLVETQIDSQQSLADDWEETQIVKEGTLPSSISEACFSTSLLDKRAERHSRISIDWMFLYCNSIYLLFIKLKTTMLRVGGCYAF